MNEEEEFYGQEEEGFEELVEKSLGTTLDNKEEDAEIEEDLLSDLEDYDNTEVGENNAAVKREERLQSVMNMTRNPLVAVSLGEKRDEQAIRRKVAMLCSALGGFDPNPPNEYILGVEALGCLKDLKELLKRIDEERNVWSVASACHDSGLFINDLIPIMVQYGSIDTTNQNPETVKILLVSIELMVRLLTPLRLEDDSKENKIELHAKLRRAQIEYKYHLLHYKKGKIFKYLIAMIIPILQLEMKNVTRRDNIILNLCLTLFANVLRIQPSDARSAKKGRNSIINVFETLPAGITEEDISIDVVLAVYKKYQVLSIVQTIASNLSKEFETEILGTACLDFYFHLFFNIDPAIISEEITIAPTLQETLSKKLNLSDVNEHNDKTAMSAINNRLQKLIEVENVRKKELYSRNSTRHANFGSLINVQDNKSNRVLSGQNNLLNSNVLEMLDSNASKTGSGKALNRRFKGNLGPEKFIKPNHKTRNLLNKFVEDFIENGFSVISKEIYNVLLKNATVQDHTFDYHYYFIVKWILKYEKNIQATNRKGLKIVERYKYLFYWFSKKAIDSLMSFILDLSRDKTYDILTITISILKEIMQAAISLHSYEHFDTSKLLSDDKALLNALVARGEGTLRLIFSINSEISELLALPKNSHQKSPPFAMEMTEFTSTVLKVIKYIQCLKVPIMLAGKNAEDYDEGAVFEENANVKLQHKNLKRYKMLDKSQCDRFKEILFHDQTVNTHLWLFYQYTEINETKLKLCLSYFSKLLEYSESNILKLVRLDFMLVLYQLKDSPISATLKVEFGDLMNFFMHKLAKMFSNTPRIMLEPMSFSEMTDAEIRKYYITGDPFASADLTVREQKSMSKAGTEDIYFVDDNISDNEKIAVLVSHMYFQDKTSILELFLQYLTQWYHEMDKSMTDSVPVVGKLGSYRLDGACLKECRTNPYFRLLCRQGNIINGILIKREMFELQSYKEKIEISLNTPLESFELENRIIDPNIVIRQSKKLGIKKTRALGYDGDGSDVDSIDRHHGYGDEGINDDEDDDLAGSDNEDQDALGLMEAQLSYLDNRVKGKAMRKNSEGELVEIGKSGKVKTRSKRRKRRRNIASGDSQNKEKTSINKKRIYKRRKIVVDDDEVLSDREILRRTHLSKEFINNSDDELSNDDEFFEREQKLQQLLQKRHGKITKEQYESLMNGTLNLNEVSDLDDNLVSDNENLGPQTAHSKPDRDSLMKLLQPSGSKTLSDGEDNDSIISFSSSDSENFERQEEEEEKRESDDDDEDDGKTSKKSQDIISGSSDEGLNSSLSDDDEEDIFSIDEFGIEHQDSNNDINPLISDEDDSPYGVTKDMKRNLQGKSYPSIINGLEFDSDYDSGSDVNEERRNKESNTKEKSSAPLTQNEGDVFANLRAMHQLMSTDESMSQAKEGV